jgi:hypothetical protein
MESFLTTIGILFFTFLVLAAAVEAIVEALRGVFEFIPTDKNPLKPRISLDDALKLSDEFAVGNNTLEVKVAGIKKVAQQIEGLSSSTASMLDAALKSKPKPEDAAAAVNAITSDLKKTLDAKDRYKILILRILSATIGCLLVWWLKVNVFDILVDQPNAPTFLVQNKELLQSDFLSILLGGLAAAAGSSYWHDQLDRVRKLKEVTKQVNAVVKKQE